MTNIGKKIIFTSTTNSFLYSEIFIRSGWEQVFKFRFLEFKWSRKIFAFNEPFTNTSHLSFDDLFKCNIVFATSIKNWPLTLDAANKNSNTVIKSKTF